MNELFGGLYTNFTLAELDSTADSRSRGAGYPLNLDPGAISLRVTLNERLNRSRGWSARKRTLLQFDRLFLNHREFAKQG